MISEGREFYAYIWTVLPRGGFSKINFAVEIHTNNILHKKEREIVFVVLSNISFHPIYYGAIYFYMYLLCLLIKNNMYIYF